MGWFLSGTLIGPAIGPFIGGIIVTYTDWTVIFWVQAGLAGLAALGAFLVLPETIHHKKYDDLEGLSTRKKASVLANMINPWRVLKLFMLYPNLYVESLWSLRFSFAWDERGQGLLLRSIRAAACFASVYFCRPRRSSC